MKSSFCRISFNTSFLVNNGLVVTKQSVSPDSVKKDNRFAENFLIKMIMEDYCHTCNKPQETVIENLCPKCSEILADEIPNWKAMRVIVN